MGLVNYFIRRRAHGRAEFRRHSGISAQYDPFEIASGFHFLTSPLALFSSFSSSSAMCSITILRGPPAVAVPQFLGGCISKSFSRVPSFFILSTIRYQAQSTSLLISHLPLLVPPHGPFSNDFEQRTMGQMPPVR